MSEPSGVEGDGEREHAVVDEEDMKTEWRERRSYLTESIIV